jgi:hypothetical protein
VVERAALFVERREPPRLARQRPVAGLRLDAAPGGLRRDVEEHGEAAVAEALARDGREHRPAPERDHRVRLGEQPPDDALLERPERGLPVLVEDRRDAAAGLALDLAVGVEERPPEPRGQILAGRGLAGAHEADERQVPERARDHWRAMRST